MTFDERLGIPEGLNEELKEHLRKNLFRYDPGTKRHRARVWFHRDINGVCLKTELHCHGADIIFGCLRCCIGKP